MIRLLIALTLALAASACHAQILDATITGQLDGEDNTIRFEGYYHLWNLGDPGPSIPDAVWEDVTDAVTAGADVWLNIEPDVSANESWQRPVDPSKASMAEVRQTHAIIAEQLEPLCTLARKTGSRVWLYGVLSPVYTRTNDIVNYPANWQADVRKIQTLKFDGSKSLAKMLHDTGGGILYEVYIPQDWNGASGWQIAKSVELLERQAEIIDSNGLRGIPLIRLDSITAVDLNTTLSGAVIFAAKSRGRVAVWGIYGGGGEFDDPSYQYDSGQKLLLQQ